MRKICYLLPQYQSDSAENFYHIINFLSELGKKVELYVIIENSDKNPKIDNVKEIFIINENKKNNYFIRFIKIIILFMKLYKSGVKIFFSRASSTGVFPLVIANRLLNFNRAKILFWNCGQDVVPLSFNPTKKNMKRILTKVLSKFIFNGINYLATGPVLMVDYYNKQHEIPKDKILLLYNDISLKRFYPLSFDEKNCLKQQVLGTRKKVMLFVHTFNYSRGTDLLHKIALKLKEKNLDVLLLAIGREGDYSSKLEEEIKKYKLSDYLINYGKIANRDIVKYYQISDLFIMPSRGEGFPRVLIEAMACKCVPFSFDVGGVRNIIHDNIINDTVVNVSDEDMFIEKSINLISEDRLLDDFANLSYEKVQEYSTEKIIKMYLEKFEFVNKSYNNV